jgi:hypothetical protein
MANPEHLAILKQGVGVWNRWRQSNPGNPPFMTLDQAQAFVARRWSPLSLQYDFSGATFQSWDLSGANLSDCNFREADLGQVRLFQANLDRSYLIRANLAGPDLMITAPYTNFTGAKLQYARFSNTFFYESDFRNAQIGSTFFSGVDLRRAIGLDSVCHEARSSIDTLTLSYSEGAIPATFLRGAGVPEPFVVYGQSLSIRPIHYFSCFISHSSEDQGFVGQFYSDLRLQDIRCWCAPEDLKIGDPFRQRIDESIRVHDKLLVILSEHSVESPWVRDEVEAALERERIENRLVLFPIRLDDAVMKTKQAWAASIRRTRHIGNFSDWKNHDSYQRAFQRLLRDLKAEQRESP